VNYDRSLEAIDSKRPPKMRAIRRPRSDSYALILEEFVPKSIPMSVVPVALWITEPFFELTVDIKPVGPKAQVVVATFTPDRSAGAPISAPKRQFAWLMERKKRSWSAQFVTRAEYSDLDLSLIHISEPTRPY